MGFRNLLTSDNSNWVMPDPSADTTFLTQEQWNQQTPTKVMSANEYEQSLPTLVPDGNNGYEYAQNPSYSEYLSSLPDALKQTKEYTANKAQDLANGIYGAWMANNSNLAGGYRVPEWTQQLEDIKQTDPQAYYNAKIGMLANQAGWDAGQNKTNADTNAQIASLGQEAIKAGVAPDQLNSLINTNYSGQAQGHATRLSQMGSGAALEGLPQFAATAAALGVGLGGLIGAFAPVALAEGGAALGGADAYMASAGLNPGTFAGADFAMPAFSAYTSPTDYMSQAGLDVGTYAPADFITPQMPIGDQPGDYPMPGEDGTAPEWKPSNINPQDVTNLLDYNAAYATPGMSANDALNAANKLRQAIGIGSSIGKVLGGGGTSGTTGSSTGSTTSGAIGTDLSKLASLLRPTQYQGIELGQIQPKNPFTFTSPGQTQASQGMYDVSGSNIANALRKA